MKRALKIKLKEILKERSMEQKELATMTGLTTRTISELCTNTTKRYPKDVIAKIADALDITDLNKLFYIDEDDSE